MSNSWAQQLLTRTSLSSYLIEDILRETGGLDHDLQKKLALKIETKADLKNLREAAKLLKNNISRETSETLKEEIQEIAKDFKWSGTTRGKYIMTINNWIHTFHSEFRAMKEFEDAMIGGHTEMMVVFVCGKVKSNDVREKLLKYVQSKNPPFKIHVKLDVIDRMHD